MCSKIKKVWLLFFYNNSILNKNNILRVCVWGSVTLAQFLHDYLIFVDVDNFGLKVGQEGYEAKYDLDRNEVIGIPDFLIFVEDFGKAVSQVPVFTSEPPVMRFVEEDTPSGQLIGEPISARSADGESLTYSLWGIDAEYFAIDASTGQLETKEAYNFEKRTWYSPIVRVSNGKGGQVSVVVNIAIIDVVE